MRRRWLIVAWGCAACTPGSIGDPVDPEPPEGAAWGDPIPCDDPTAGWDRFTEEAFARGLSQPVEAIINGAYLIARDLDGDGDVDLLYDHQGQGLGLRRNDGAGRFGAPELLPDTEFRAAVPVAADLDDDGVAEIVAIDDQTIRAFTAGDDGFVVRTLADRVPGPRVATAMFGDVDGDGDLDLAMPGAERAEDIDLPPGTKDWAGSPDQVLRLADGALGDPIELVTEANTIVLAGTWTDRDDDGDLDLFLPSDRTLLAAFWRNDGVLVEDAAAIGAAIPAAAMGVDSADFNADGVLDYCVTDNGPIVCLVSAGDLWAEATATMGLTPLEPVGFRETVGWSVDLLDLDHDGRLDAWQPAGPMEGGGPSQEAYPDLLYAGGDGQPPFTDVSAIAGIDDDADHYGGAAADLDGDGSLDLITVGPGDIPRLWMNRCAAGAWLAVDLEGPPGNRDGIGARIDVVAGGRTWVQELQTMRGMGQRPAVAHFGLGEADEASVVVRWPGGERTELDGVPLRRRVTVAY